MTRAVDRLLEHYEQIAAACAAMLAAASAADWTAFEAQRVRRDTLIAAASGVSIALDPAQARRRVELLRAALADDAAIRVLCDSGSNQLDRLVMGRL